MQPHLLQSPGIFHRNIQFCQTPSSLQTSTAQTSSWDKRLTLEQSPGKARDPLSRGEDNALASGRVQRPRPKGHLESVNTFIFIKLSPWATQEGIWSSVPW